MYYVLTVKRSNSSSELKEVKEHFYGALIQSPATISESKDDVPSVCTPVNQFRGHSESLSEYTYDKPLSSAAAILNSKAAFRVIHL